MTELAPGTALPVRSNFDPAKSIEPHILAKLDPEWVKAFTHKMNTDPPPPRDQWTIEAIRAHPEWTAPACALDTKGYPRTAEREVVSEDGAKIPARVYYPDESQHGPGPYPVHLNFHGMYTKRYVFSSVSELAVTQVITC